MIYFDNAATTFPKPICVSEDMRKCVRVYGGNPGRGAHALSLEAAKFFAKEGILLFGNAL